jgi:Domain of unknown function (DUF1707)
VTTRPGDETAAGARGRGHLRASHADRERVVGTLKAAFVAGMLAKDEFDLRVGQALASRTYADLATLTADLPTGLAVTQPPKPARTQARRPMNNAAKASKWAVIAIAVPVVLSLVTGSPLPFFIFPSFYLMIAVIEVLASWDEKRSRRGQLPPGPASSRGGPASPQPPAVGPGRQPPPVDPGRRHTVEAAQSRLPRPPSPPRRGHPLGRRYATG